MTVSSHAKINLGLHILRKREDGYHDIDTVFHRIGMADRVTLRRVERGIRCLCSDPAIPTDERNLCVRAARALLDATGNDAGVVIDLEKTIPAGAGLGGGSSNAAAVLRALPSLLSIDIAEDDLFRIAAGLGSDIPYFLHPGSAHATGRGERLSYFMLEVPYWILVTVPPVHVSTAWAYGAFTVDPSLPVRNIRTLLSDNIHNARALVNTLRNDFEPVVFAAYEEVMRTKEILVRTGADFALMSGSGAAVFGLFADEAYAREAADFFAKRHPVSLTPPGHTF
ncbi:MAG: 4-(cytidine 5'-diphospho)-2-C-methyl-D-erythritol kinase [Ignavibacteriae bacterium]|nr:4-(cytidine 5'-diphospho)-2-C-methyl-D-erythritol kinase [Ignavibacteriota bacterium]